jgi:hypothetical protein
MNREIEISPYGSLLVYKKTYTANYVRSIILERKLRGLRVFVQLKDDRLADLQFLNEFSFLEALDVTSVDDYDFSFLANMKKMKDLRIIVKGDKPINLGNQINLESLTIQWRKEILGLDKCRNIASLCMVDYAEKDLAPIASLNNLNEIKIKSAMIKNLDGIESFTKLKSMLLGNCRKLVSIKKIECMKQLVSLNIESCTKISDYNAIGKLSNLENLQIINCGGICTIKFIEGLSSLKRIELLGSTDVMDGDMMPAKNINEVLYKHRKHYNIRIENEDYSNTISENLKKLRG